MSEPLSERALRRLLEVAADAPADAGAPVPARYEIVRELGRGGMGVVCEAIDHQLGRRCALKRIAAAGATDELRARLVREATAAARLRHPHIAAVYDATPDYISMQLIAGAPIDTIHPGERRLLVELVRDAARAVHHAHEHGIVHRDLKPSNLLVEGRHVFVVDFGLAKEIATEASLSLAGAVLGTPAFMPPEQALGRSGDVDARSDVYALGATLHACLLGVPPFTDRDLPTLLRRVVEEEPRPPRVDRDLDLVLLKCLAKAPGERYPSAADLAADLDRWLREEPVLARRPSLRHRLRKFLARRRSLVRTALVAAAVAGIAMALVLVPIALRESAARAAAGEAVALADRAAAVLQDTAVFHRLGDLASTHAALDRDIARAREFLGRHDVPRVRYLLSRLLRARGQLDEALVELERAIAADPALEEARFTRGLMRAARNDLTAPERAAAIADLSVAVPANTVLTHVDLLFGRAERQRLAGDLDAATAGLQEVLAYEPTHVGARLSLAAAALARGDGELARHYAVSASDLQQGYGPAYVARERRQLPTTILGMDELLIDFTARLADGADNALALAHRGVVNLRRALRLEAEGALGEALAAATCAVEDHDVALSIHTDLAGALNNRAACLLQVARLRAALRDDPGAADARRRAAGDLDQARASMPGAPEPHFNAGLLALQQAAMLRAHGRDDAAAACTERAIADLGAALAAAPAEWPHAHGCQARIDAARRGSRR